MQALIFILRSPLTLLLIHRKGNLFHRYLLVLGPSKLRQPVIISTKYSASSVSQFLYFEASFPRLLKILLVLYFAQPQPRCGAKLRKSPGLCQSLLPRPQPHFRNGSGLPCCLPVLSSSRAISELQPSNSLPNSQPIAMIWENQYQRKQAPRPAFYF